MPTAQQLDNMLKMIKDDKEVLITSVKSLIGAFEPLKHMFNGLIGSISGFGNKHKDM
jgi:hypothetical protein